MAARLTPNPLPIDAAVPELRRALERSTRVVLVAPPGAGKTTHVPLALRDAPWLHGGKIVMLEPRRLAARAAARRMASLLGERVAQTVGYRVRFDTKIGPFTRLEVVTEGVLTRMLQSDPTLGGVGAVIFDEFHERSLQADLGLALTLHAQRLVCEDLRVLVMSATLDGEGVARTIDAPLVRSDGRMFPVTTEYRPRGDRERVEGAVARVVREAISKSGGDVLAFLPGAAEIRRVADDLTAAIDDPKVDVRPLYGDLPGDTQDAAIAPSPAGRRKIVLATNIAETSITIDGVRIVVDGGLARAPRFSPRTGLTRLDTVRISRASADQRRGRAGRTAPGVCYRLWSAADDAQLAPRNVPEILEADLAPLALELAAAGIADPVVLTWLDPPPAGALAQGRDLLATLGAIDDDGRLTAHGARIAELGTHPRLAQLIIRGNEIGGGALACALAALLANRDILRPVAPGARIEADVRARIEAFMGKHGDAMARVDRDTLHRVKTEARAWRQAIRVADDAQLDVNATGLLLSFAYPDRIARKRGSGAGRFLLANGTGAHFDEPQPLGGDEWLVIAETDGRAPEARIFLAAPVSLADLTEHHRETFVTADDVRWDDGAGKVVASRRTMFGAIVVKERGLAEPPPDFVRDPLLDALHARGIAALPWSEGAQRLRERLAFLHHHDAAWPDVSDGALLATLREWLAPAVDGARSLSDVARADLGGALLAMLDWKQRSQLETLAPAHIEVPSGSRMTVDYSNPDAPALSVRLQEVFGLASTPTVLGGRVPVTLHLLSPAHRPVQVTRDLAAFWRGSYADVRKEMRGRYPKHDWPEDPASATPSRGRKRK